jgi:hypothetical protein
MKLMIDVAAGVAVGGIPLIFISAIFQSYHSQEEAMGMKISAGIGAAMAAALVAAAVWLDR